MRKLSKLLLVTSVLFGAALSAFADRGVAKKSKSKITLNISTPTTLKNSVSLNFKSGLRYSGSMLLGQHTINNSMITSNTLVSYQKGNTVYIIPYKQKIVMPEIKPGYTGMKLILRSH